MTDPITWLLQIEDSTLTGRIINLGDGAGLTRFGIASKDWGTTLPAFFWTNAITPAVAEAIAKQFYTKEYWNKLNLGEVPMPLAASVLSCAVNCGSGHARIFLVAANQHAQLNDQLNSFIEEWSHYYRSLAALKPTDARFLDGWLARASAIFPNLPR